MFDSEQIFDPGVPLFAERFQRFVVGSACVAVFDELQITGQKCLSFGVIGFQPP